MLKRNLLFAVLLAFSDLVTGRIASAKPEPDTPATVVFKNGDVLSGSLLGVDGQVVEMRSAALGELKIRWTDIQEVKTQNGSYRRAAIRPSATDDVDFQNAVMRNVRSRAVIAPDSRSAAPPDGESVVFVGQEHPASGLPNVPNAKPARAPQPDTSISISLNAPESVAIGTQSQYVFGGTLGILHNEADLCAMPSWTSALLASANHNKSFEKGGAAVVTDNYDGTLSLTNKLGSETQVAGYIVADFFGNSSLGVGLQQSYGFGVNRVLYTNACRGTKPIQPKGYRFEINGDASLRYIHQRLYSPGGSEDLAGVRLTENLRYDRYGKDKAGEAKTLFSITQSLWVTPMLNEGRAVQAGGDLQLTIPLSKSLSIGIDEKDDFFNNAPLAKRKNYLQSALKVTYTFPPPAK